ncbi:sensor histidine kinase [Rhodoplanes roseus]|uniref:histidine kinase n=1 Tax=Rhodoplanes roseus TaxID=29409 RepID=A0A327L0H0_9BRAD|nr:histidine kinase dimerization/phosphoacceptor domain -containing protein [Rhodoplanes roseus]RAI43435.1 hypothetical protein CH341_14425 [Rhodoplanes roseus]
MLPNDERSREYLRAITGFTRFASETVTPDRLMQHAVAQVSRVTDVGHVKVLRYRAEHGDLLVEAGVGWKDGVVGHATLGLEISSPPGRAVQTGGTVVIDDLPHDREYRLSGLLRDHGIVSLVNVPIMIDGRTWGVLEADSEMPRRFDEWDVDFLTAMANALGCALARHAAEQNVSAAQSRVVQAQAHAEIVLREFQHRVKNNLQLIVSFMALKRRETTAEETYDVLGTAMTRVQTIAVAHDLLSKGKDATGIRFDQYLRALCANINPDQGSVSIQVTAADALLPLDRAVPAALVVNELVTNALKYAFGEHGGTIRVGFDLASNGSEARIFVEDDGAGLPQPRKAGFGLKMIEAFAQQLAGRVTYGSAERSGNGTRIEVIFPVVPGPIDIRHS